METDACGTGIGGVIMKSGRPIAFFNKKLGVKASAQSIYDKEAMAILETLRRWRHYFLDGKLIIKTNQQSKIYY